MSTPIVLGVEGEVAEIIDESKAGMCIEPENAEQLASTIIRLADDKSVYLEKASAGRAFVEANFDRKKLAHDIADIFSQLVSS